MVPCLNSMCEGVYIKQNNRAALCGLEDLLDAQRPVKISYCQSDGDDRVTRRGLAI